MVGLLILAFLYATWKIWLVVFIIIGVIAFIAYEPPHYDSIADYVAYNEHLKKRYERDGY